MKAFAVGDRSGIASLKPITKLEPELRPEHIIVAPKLVTLISRDLQMLRGTYGGSQPADRIPMSEGVGIVTAVSDDVTEFSIGDRVVCGHFLNWLEGDFRTEIFGVDLGITQDGWLAERVALPAKSAIRVPEGLDDKDVAGLASAGLTAWNALIEVARIKAGELVLCLGTGSVSLAALKIAKAQGARVAVTSSSEEKLVVARKLGADICVNYATHPDWPAAVKELNSGRGVDVIVETGGQDTLGQSISAAGQNATIIVIGVSPGKLNAIPDYTSLITKNITIRGIANGSRAMFVDLLRAVQSAEIETVVAKTFEFDDAPSAFACFADAKHIGRIMISGAS